MKTETLRRPYAAPAAELICLVPGESVATNSWQWDSGNNNNKWDQNHMGIDVFGLGGSAIGFGKWTGTNELDDEQNTP